MSEVCALRTTATARARTVTGTRSGPRLNQLSVVPSALRSARKQESAIDIIVKPIPSSSIPTAADPLMPARKEPEIGRMAWI